MWEKFNTIAYPGPSGRNSGNARAHILPKHEASRSQSFFLAYFSTEALGDVFAGVHWTVV